MVNVASRLQSLSAPGEILKWLGDRPGNRTAGLLDPIRCADAMGRPLQREFRQNDELRRLGALHRRIDESARMRDVLIDDRPCAAMVSSLDREFARGLDA